MASALVSSFPDKVPVSLTVVFTSIELALLAASALVVAKLRLVARVEAELLLLPLLLLLLLEFPIEGWLPLRELGILCRDAVFWKGPW